MSDYIDKLIDLGATGARAQGEKWKSYEDEIIREFFPDEGEDVSARLPGRSPSACMARAWKLGVRKKRKSPPLENWEKDIIKDLYQEDKERLKEILAHRSWQTIKTAAMHLGVAETKAKNWSQQEKDTIVKYWVEEGRDVYKRLPGRTPMACQRMASMLNVTKKRCRYAPWTEVEDETLIKYYPEEGEKAFSRLPQRSVGACRSRVFKLGLYFDKRKNKNPRRHQGYTEAEDAIIHQYFPTEGIAVAKRLPERTAASVEYRARRLGVKKIKAIKPVNKPARKKSIYKSSDFENFHDLYLDWKSGLLSLRGFARLLGINYHNTLRVMLIREGYLK